SRRRHTRFSRDWSSDVCSSDLRLRAGPEGNTPRMTRTRVFAALAMAPVAIAAVLLLPTPWLVAAAMVVFLGGLWEWLRLSGLEDGVARSALLVANLLLILALVWASASDPNASLVLLKLFSVAAVVGWLLVALWLRRPAFGADNGPRARTIKLRSEEYTSELQSRENLVC